MAEMALSSQRKIEASRNGHSDNDCGAKGKMPFNLAIACDSLTLNHGAYLPVRVCDMLSCSLSNLIRS
jgi:hypothetical protein